MFPERDFPHTAAAIREGIDRGLHTGIQIYVSHDGVALLDAALGESSPGSPMTADTWMPWRSAGKPLTALLILGRVASGVLSLDGPIAEWFPEYRDSDKAQITIRDLLTHQSGFPATDTGWPHVSWEESVRNSMLTPRQYPVGTAAYHPQSSWFLLGEILLRTVKDSSSCDFPELLRSELLEPLGIAECMCGVRQMSQEGQLSETPGDGRPVAEFPALFDRNAGRLTPSDYAEELWISRASPGGNLRGPVRNLGRVYEELLCPGKHVPGAALVSEATVVQMTSRHRAGQYDLTLQHVVDFGLGVICNSSQYGADTVPYGFGRFAGDRTFGHGGSQCSMGFCDPEFGYVVAWAANGFCGEGQHQRRNRLINEAVYRDLGWDS